MPATFSNAPLATIDIPALKPSRFILDPGTRKRSLCLCCFFLLFMQLARLTLVPPLRHGARIGLDAHDSTAEAGVRIPRLTLRGFFGTHRRVRSLCLCCLCCLCNKLARHWFIPKTRHTNCVGGRRDTPGSCRAHSPALRVGGRVRVALWSWSCTSHPHAHPHALEELVTRQPLLPATARSVSPAVSRSKPVPAGRASW